MAGQPSPSGMRCHRGGVADSKLYSMQRVCTQLSNPKPPTVMRATYARRFWVEENLAKLFFAIVWAGENSRRSFFLPWFRGTLRAWGMLGVRHVRRRWGGDFGRRQEATERQRAMRVRGSAQGREMSLTRFVFFRLLSTSLE